MRFSIALLAAACFLSSHLQTIGQEKKVAIERPVPVIEVSLDEAEKLTQSNTNLVVLDVRTRKEFAAGHLAGAKNIDFYAPDFKEQLLKLDRSQPVLVHCATGGRSAEARDQMRQMGFKKIFHMSDGFKGWSTYEGCQGCNSSSFSYSFLSFQTTSLRGNERFFSFSCFSGLFGVVINVRLAGFL